LLNIFFAKLCDEKIDSHNKEDDEDANAIDQNSLRYFLAIVSLK